MKKEPIRFTAAGDILITKKIPRENDGIAEIRRYIKRGDIRMANLETTVTDGTCFASAFSGGTWLTVDKSCLLDIKRYGFNMLGLANNHSMDYSYEGLNMTIDNVNKAGFFYAGSGKNLYEAARPAMIETKNGRVGVIDICSTFENAARAGSQTPRIPGRPGLNALRTHNLYKITKEHAAYLEEKLKKMLEAVQGLGEVEVMVTLESSEEKIVEKDMTAERSNTEEQDAAGGARTVNTSNTEYRTIYREDTGGDPFVVKTITPKVEGVLVVAEGAGKGNMAGEITQIIQALFGVEAHRIKVLEK